jgi:chromosome segregation ATPase
MTTTPTITDTEAQLDRTRRDLERAQARLAEAARELADSAGSPHQFDRIRRRRDDAAGEVERLSLHLANLRVRCAAEREQVKEKRKAAAQREAAALEHEIARLDREGVAAASRLADVARQIEAARSRALELSRQIDPRAYPTAAEPIEFYRVLAAVLNSVRKACMFGKAAPEAERQFALPDPARDQAA